MTPVHCITKHDPPHCVGDCVRACVASILDLPCDAVEHFFSDDCDGPTGHERLASWLIKRGYAPFYVHYDGAMPLVDVMGVMQETNSNAYFMLFGNSASGSHVVVCQGDKVVNDPSWTPSPIVAPNDNGIWTLMVITRG